MMNLEELDPHRLVVDALGPSFDEAAAGHAKLVQVVLHSDGSCSVQDDGRGIPVGMHTEGKSALELVLCTLHTGGKSIRPSYGVSGGPRGVGLPAVNGQSEWLEATIHRDGHEWFLRTEQGVPVKPTERKGASIKRGTSIRFKPDPTVFKGKQSLEFESLTKVLRELSIINKGVHIRLMDERSGKSEDFRTDPAVT